MVALNPRGVGEVLSDAASLLRRNLGAFVWVALPFCAVELALREAGTSMVFGAFKRAARAAEDGDLRSVLSAEIGAGAAFILASIVIGQVLSAALVPIAARLFLGRGPAEEGLLQRFRRGPAVVATLLVWFAALGIATAGPLLLPLGAALLELWVPALLLLFAAAAGALVLFIVLGLRFALWPQAVVLEDRWGPRALARSSALMASRGEPFFDGAKFRLSVLLLIYFGVASTLQSLFMIPRVVFWMLSGSLLDGPPPLASLPLWFLVPLALVEVATNAIVVPLSSVITTVFYFDARVRCEGFDESDAAS